MPIKITITKLVVVLIAFLTILVWQKTLNQAFLGEGYYYFEPQQRIITSHGINTSSIWELDNFARFMFDVLPTLFRDNFTYYFAFQIFVLILINITFFLLINYVTKNKILSITATILFLASYVGLFEMIAAGNYQRFAQRVPNIIPSLLSIFCLIKYLETKQFKYYLFSIISFAFSIFIAHFSTFLLPFLVIYTLLWAFLQKNNITAIIRYLAISGSFILINALIISRDVHTPHQNILVFIQERGIISIAQQIFLQHANIVLPTFLIEKIASIANPYTDTLIIISLPIIVLYLVGLFLILKKELKLKFKLFYLASLLTIPVLLFLNLYLGKVDAAYNIKGYTYYFIPSYYTQQVSRDLQIKGDRAYMVPSIFISILWGYLIWIFLSKNKKIYLSLTFIILFLYVLNNISLINRNLEVIQFNSEVMKNYIAYTKSISNQFNQNTIIVAPQPLIWPSALIRLFYGDPEMKFISANMKWQDDIKNVNQDDLILLDYDYRNNKVINITNKFKNGEDIIFRGY